MLRTFLLALCCLCCATGLSAQEREKKVRDDKDRFENDDVWVYNDLPKAIAEARRTKKPLLVVFRCIPCEACSQFDKQVIDKQTKVRDVLDKFVCARIVQANNLDLSLFQFDFDQSFHAVFMNADKVIYGRFGTRSAREEDEDMNIDGFREALNGALALHAGYPGNKAQFEGKQASPSPVKVPEDFPSLKGKYGPKLDYKVNVVRTCIHCHQVREAQREMVRESGKGLPDNLLYPYPLPDVLGLTMDPDQKATVKAVAEDSRAAHAGLKPGDNIDSINGQTLLSTADLQWVLHNMPASGALDCKVTRDGKQVSIKIPLEEGWRTHSDISFRPTTWQLRGWATGGLVFEDLPAEERKKLKLGENKLALRIKYVGQYNQHAAGKNAGFQKGDVITSFDGDDAHLTETGLIARMLEHKVGEQVPLTLLRNGERKELKLPVQ